MPLSHSLPQEAWDQRYRAAAAALLDSERVLQAWKQITRIPGTVSAPMAILAGGEKIARARRVAVFAGSFNPQTIAHELVAMTSQAARSIDTFIWGVSRVTIDKEAVERATLADRIVQLEAYVNSTSTDALALLDAGLYVDQAASIRAVAPEDATVWLVVGFDKVVQIFDPHYYADRDGSLRHLFSQARLLVVPRAGHSEADLRLLLNVPENQPFADGVDFLDIGDGVTTISSSLVRVQAAHLSSEASMAVVAHGMSLTPEGAALTMVTDAYRAPRMLPDGEMVDAYGLRQRWLAALEAATPAERRAVALEWLVRVSMGADAKGVALRRWLDGAHTSDGTARLSDLIECYR